MANKKNLNAEACELKDDECKTGKSKDDKCKDSNLKGEKCKTGEPKGKDVDDAETADTEVEDTPKEEENADDDMANKYVRLMAEFQNYKKRVSKEKDDLRSYANENLVLSLLEVLDNFERALKHDADDEGFVAGMQMIFKQMIDKLNKAGLEEIKALGADFDPNFHNAVLTGDDPQYESGKVTDVMQKGYTLNGKVIRAAMVKVNN